MTTDSKDIGSRKAKGMKVIKLPISELRLSKTRWKRKEHDIDELAKSIKHHGVLQPVIARQRNGKTFIVAGAHRLRAAKKVGLKKLPVTLIDVDNDEAEMRSIEENIQRFEPDSYERRMAIGRYRELWEKKNGKPKRGRPKKNGAQRASFEKETSRKFGVDRSTVKRAVAAKKKLHPKVKRAWKAKKITTAQADRLTSLPAKGQLALLPTLVNQGPAATCAAAESEKQSMDKGGLCDRLKDRLVKAAAHAAKMNRQLHMARKVIRKMDASDRAQVASIFLPGDLATAIERLEWLRGKLGDQVKAAA